MRTSRLQLLITLLMTVFIGLVLSAVFTLDVTGPTPAFWGAWLGRFVSTWVIVLPTVLVVAPLAQTVASAIHDRLWPPHETSARDVALAAWRANGAGHAGGDFQPWLDSLADDVRITMPLGPFRGETVGKSAVEAIYAAIASAEPRLVYEPPLRVTQSGDTVVVEFDDHGTIAGRPYHNRIAGSFDIRDGKVAAYREYFGDIDPAIVRLMNGNPNS